MCEKYDLNKMIEEIEEDERSERGDNRKEDQKLSQDAIKKMMLDRLRKEKEKKA